MDHTYLKPPHAEDSVDRIFVHCPSCDELCIINMGFLTSESRIVFLTVCGACEDHITIRAYMKLTPSEYIFMKLMGVMFIDYVEKE